MSGKILGVKLGSFCWLIFKHIKLKAFYYFSFKESHIIENKYRIN